MKHAKLFEEFINESDSESRDFASRMADLEEKLQKDNKNIWNKFEKSSSKFWKEINVDSWEEAFEKDPNGCMSFQEELESHLNESLEFDEAVNELSLSSVGVRSFLRAMYTNADVLKKMGFRSFKDLVSYVKSNDIEDWDELRDEARELGLVVVESFINESSQSDKLAIEIDKSINKIDDSMSYEDFATAVAKILEDNYGEHNYAPFMKVLHSKLGIK